MIMQNLCVEVAKKGIILALLAVQTITVVILTVLIKKLAKLGVSGVELCLNASIRVEMKIYASWIYCLRHHIFFYLFLR